jgi:two-component system, NarL family, response regulator NreC
MDDSSPTAPRVLLADDRTILRERLRGLLTGDESLELIGASEDQPDAASPDVALIDLSLPELAGLDAIREIKRRYPRARTLVLTVERSAESVHAALKAGADGYLLKEASRAELLLAIGTVLRGKPFISPAVSQGLVAKYLEDRDDAGTRAVGRLSARETQVLKRIAEGQRNRQIADELAISVKTVEKHRANLMHKLKLHNTAALTSFAIENRLTGRPSRSPR